MMSKYKPHKANKVTLGDNPYRQIDHKVEMYIALNGRNFEIIRLTARTYAVYDCGRNILGQGIMCDRLTPEIAMQMVAEFI